MLFSSLLLALLPVVTTQDEPVPPPPVEEPAPEANQEPVKPAPAKPAPEVTQPAADPAPVPAEPTAATQANAEVEQALQPQAQPIQEPAVQEPPPAPEDPARRRLRAADFARVRQVTEIESAGDGSQAVIAVREVYGDPTDREDAHGYRTHLYLLRRGSDTFDQLTHGERGGSSPAISPDGRTLAFLRPGEGEDEERGAGTSQVWLMSTNQPGEARQLTHVEGGLGNPRWLPHGGALLLSRSREAGEIDGPSPYDVERPGRTTADIPEGTEPGFQDLARLRAWMTAGAEDGAPSVFHRVDFQAEQGLAGAPSVAQLVRIDASTGALHELSSGWRDAGNGVVSPDGRRVAFISNIQTDGQHPDRSRHSGLFLLELAGGAPRQLFADPTRTVDEVVWSDDGATLYACLSDTSEPTFALSKLVALSLESPSPRELLPDFDGDVFNLDYAGGVLTFRANVEGSVQLHGLDLESGVARGIVEPDGGVLAYSLGANGRILYALSEGANPCEVYRLEGGAEHPRLTDLHASWLADYELSLPTADWVERDGEPRVQYWRMPALGVAADAKVPVLLQTHGGPHVMWGPGSFTMWHELQFFAARGYHVVYANPRGSSGYGYDFRKGNYRDWGVGPAGDVLAALDASLSQLPGADPQQLFTTGGSYAGYLTAWIVSQDHRFKAAAAQRGVYDLATFFGEGNAWRLVEWSFGGMPWNAEVRALLDAQSPFTHVDKITTPLLILHANQDLRTGVTQSEMMYRALKALERPVEYVRYPEAGHDLSRAGDPVQRIDRLTRIAEFFVRFGGA